MTALTDSPAVLVYTDGASRGNPGPAAVGYAIFDPSGRCLERDGKYVGEHTNNEAEYEALLWAIEKASSYTLDSVRFHSDSELVVHQVNGVYQVKKEHLRDYVCRIRKSVERFQSFRLVYMPRENPRIVLVDGIVNGVLDGEEARRGSIP
ncbi:MAG: ribonuclease HI family protein [Methanobacteriota archaeon]|nr:MAG: ribonuclease HI family protein [Euryarchaeota archaeon]